MAKKANINPILIHVLTAIVLLLAVARPVNASRAVVLRPPFAGIYRVTSYFDHQKPDYTTGGAYLDWPGREGTQHGARVDSKVEGFSPLPRVSSWSSSAL